MSDTSIDIIDLLHDVHPDRVTYIVQSDRRRYHAAITALVAERDGYLEGNKQALRALAEANEIAARYKQERDEARREVCDLKSTPRWNAYIPIATARRYAEERGWDCYAKEGGGA